ncbi:MAG: hypothetical protein H0W30_19075 [Gemmatimonadaceae bacterium]|nr:hypothetical protein [Gemmatimonadaceae bacterium]
MLKRTAGREDYLLRIIRQAAESIQRLREMLMASADASPHVRQEVHSSTQRLLGVQAALLTRLDAETAVRLVGSRSRAQLWANLVELEADACDCAGDTIEGTRHRVRAAALRAAADELELDA